MTSSTSAALRLIADEEKPVTVSPRLPRPHVIIAGPEKFSMDEMRTMRHVFEDRKARVTTFRMTMDFLLREFQEEIEGSTWVLIAIDQEPGRETELIRIVERAKLPLPKLGFICLADRVNILPRMRVGGGIQLIVKRTPDDTSFNSVSASAMVLAEDLTNESHVLRIARAVVPHVPE